MPQQIDLKYADYNSVSCSAEDIDALCNYLKAEVEYNAEWLRQNKLSSNTDKTEYMVASRSQTTH